MKKQLSRNRIHGVSYKRTTLGPVRSGTKTKTPRPSAHKQNQQNTGAPTPFSTQQIHALLRDAARQSLHTLMNESVEMASFWRQASRALDKNFEDTFFDDPRTREPLDISNSSEQAETLLIARRNSRLWKHRIAILEMIALAQLSLRH